MDSSTKSRTWHLATTSDQTGLADFELALMATYAAYERWALQLSRAVGHTDLGFNEVAILHLVRMHDRPKEAATIAQLLNRNDLANVLYSLRKLSSADLVAKSRSGAATLFEITEKGVEYTDRFSRLRANLMFESPDNDLVDDYHETIRTLNLMTGIYDNGSRKMAAIDPESYFE